MKRKATVKMTVGWMVVAGIAGGGSLAHAAKSPCAQTSQIGEVKKVCSLLSSYANLLYAASALKNRQYALARDLDYLQQNLVRPYEASTQKVYAVSANYNALRSKVDTVMREIRDEADAEAKAAALEHEKELKKKEEEAKKNADCSPPWNQKPAAIGRGCKVLLENWNRCTSDISKNSHPLASRFPDLLALPRKDAARGAQIYDAAARAEAIMDRVWKCTSALQGLTGDALAAQKTFGEKMADTAVGKAIEKAGNAMGNAAAAVKDAIVKKVDAVLNYVKANGKSWVKAALHKAVEMARGKAEDFLFKIVDQFIEEGVQKAADAVLPLVREVQLGIQICGWPMVASAVATACSALGVVGVGCAPTCPAVATGLIAWMKKKFVGWASGRSRGWCTG
jgi:hypothetical protein